MWILNENVINDEFYILLDTGTVHLAVVLLFVLVSDIHLQLYKKPDTYMIYKQNNQKNQL